MRRTVSSIQSVRLAGHVALHAKISPYALAILGIGPTEDAGQVRLFHIADIEMDKPRKDEREDQRKA